MIIHLLIAVATIDLVGLVLLCFVQFRWRRVAWMYSVAWVKPLLSLVKALSGVLGVLAREVPTSSHEKAVATLVLGIVGLLIWELVDQRAGAKREADREKEADEVKRREKEIDEIVRVGFVRNKLIAVLGHLVTYKKRRISRMIAEVARGRYNRDRPGAHCAALDPQEQIRLTLMHLVTFLRELLPQTEESEKQNFRVGFYVESDGYMVPVECWNHRDKSQRFLKSYKIARHKFRIDCKDHPACAVLCVQEQQLVVVPDCATTLSYYHDEQRNYLKSLIAFPIIGYGCDEGQRVAASLVVDTNVAGFFREDDRATIETYMEQFSLRLDFEMVIAKLLQKQLDTRNGTFRQGHRGKGGR